ncbi:MAG: ribonuclease III [Deltaproteobacteria bacterium]|nr:ribonuclease III [Deltaproteobacteria bacterium]
MPEKISREEKKQLKAFEKKLGYRFSKKALLKNALTHKSYANERRLDASDHNERLEYLGDAVLELIVSHLLMENYPQAAEGELSKLRASIVNEKTLAGVAVAHDLGEYLYLGKGEEMGAGREKPSLLANALEAVLGAIYLDRGFKKAFRVIKRIALELFEQVGQEGFYKDYKTQLQERAQVLFKTVPKYKLVKESGPDHDKTFEINLTIRGELMGVGVGKSKKNAEQAAAKAALERIEKQAAADGAAVASS